MLQRLLDEWNLEMDTLVVWKNLGKFNFYKGYLLEGMQNTKYYLGMRR